ncbi:MAG: DUF3253 domain-containing protein [Burkholderiaceae bacterium]|nr:DUF3253 domain-containing protein [Burkholderiaceae bacterium]
MSDPPEAGPGTPGTTEQPTAPVVTEAVAEINEAITEAITQAIEALLAARAADASICPSEVARHLRADQWRPLMPAVRRVAATMARDGRLRITQGGAELSPQAVLDGAVRGPIRLRRPQR